jgi:hypothetical protein
VVGGHDVVAQPLAQLVREALGQPAGVDEHERGAVLDHECRHLVDDVVHLLGRGDRLELAVGQVEPEVEVAPVAHVDHLGWGPVADEQPPHDLDRALGGGQADARGPAGAERLEPFERERQVGAALVARHGVDLVDDDRLDGRQGLAAPLARDHEVQRLGRGHHERRRAPQHGRPLGRGRVAGAHAHADGGRGEAHRLGRGGDLGQGALEVVGDVDRQGLERRHVGHARRGAHVGPRLVRPVQPVDGDEEPGERLARPGGGGDQRVAPRGDVRPALRLRRRGPLGEAAAEPCRHRRVEGVEGVAHRGGRRGERERQPGGGRGIDDVDHGAQCRGGV